jgi:deoxyguanosine kinase
VINLANSRYLVVDGPRGVGKTTLVKLLAETFEAKTVLERAGENPFLEKFYQDRSKYAFQTQIFYLLTRYQQQQEILQGDLFHQNIICDYLFAKDRIFACLNLSEDEMVLYDWIYQLLDQRVVKPDLVIYLQAPVSVLTKRIRKRALWYEKNIEEEYLKKVSKAYNNFFFHYKDTPLLVVNTSSIDFVKREADLKNLLREIRNTDKGIRYLTIASDVDPLP